MNAYIVSAVRTAGGRRNGRLSGRHPVELAAEVLNAVVAKSAVPAEAVDDVIMGCVSQVGEQSRQIARFAVLASNLPESVPSVTIDRQCGSSQQAVQFAAQAIMSGTQDIVIAAGVESMSRVPLGSATTQGATPMIQSIRDRYGVKDFSQFAGAEMIAKKWGFTRDDLDAFGLESHRRAIAATNAGAFDAEIVPIAIALADGTTDIHVKDEGIRWDASPEGMAGVKPVMEGGLITAATSSQITDGAAAVMIVSEKALKEYGLTPIARIASFTVTAGDPILMLEEPLYATDKALKRAGMTIGDIDLFEVNEAFAPVPLAWLKHTGADPLKMNVNGGAISLGHPVGASGAKLMATLVHALRARGAKYGLQTMCEGGGQANVTIVEAL
ncbi:acetyl-CoA C-acetyltransferase [Rhizorhapis suberifaciens]|uniref:Acetyl-CoA C-acetyltransferase n=1 Tax=Rhizorhapis suberifaciens TaxID=13656 RepID=A0A840HW57_9SPHN|nr:acetyl-CoA C-acetyltransferase [Rhizorhapis suberifaciens]MBB4641654.1 acetyl-CoA C-acetyltransferase [Rhizorhapis suberifaciens]